MIDLKAMFERDIDSLMEEDIPKYQMKCIKLWLDSLTEEEKVDNYDVLYKMFKRIQEYERTDMK